MTPAASDLARDAMSPHLRAWERVNPASPPDAVRAWLARAAAVPLDATADDLHARFVARYDDPQHGDPARTRRYLEALARVRTAADAGVAVTLAGLALVQAAALGAAAPLRTTDAYARGGAHRYPFVADFEARFGARVAAWRDPAVDPVVAACVAYLDVIFMHPFCDGNARAARLCYEWILRRAGRPMPRIEDLSRLHKTPGDVEGLWRMVRLSAASTVGARRSQVHP